MKWILIMTLVGVNGSAVHSADGFKDRSACEAAGKEWVESIYDVRVSANYSCASKLGEKSDDKS